MADQFNLDLSQFQRVSDQQDDGGELDLSTAPRVKADTPIAQAPLLAPRKKTKDEEDEENMVLRDAETPGFTDFIGQQLSNARTQAESYAVGAIEGLFATGAGEIAGLTKGAVEYGMQKLAQTLTDGPPVDPFYTFVEKNIEEFDNYRNSLRQDAPTAQQLGELTPMALGGGAFGVGRAALNQAAPRAAAGMLGQAVPQAAKGLAQKSGGALKRIAEIGVGTGLEEFAETGGDVQEAIKSGAQGVAGGGVIEGALKIPGATKAVGKHAFPIIAKTLEKGGAKFKEMVSQNIQNKLADQWVEATTGAAQKAIAKSGAAISVLRHK